MQLKYKEDNTFRIIQMTDLHIGSLPHHEDDFRTFDLIDKAIIKLEPDLVVITGDLIWTDGVPTPTKIFIELMERLNKHVVPIAITYGNHDSEMGVGRADLRVMEGLLNNLVEKKHTYIFDNKESYCLEIFDKYDKALENVLYLFDSGWYPKLHIGTYDWVQPEQINWFRKISDSYIRDCEKKDMVFMHIPIPEYWEAAKNILSGECNETNDMISAPYINTGLFSAMYINGKIDAMFCGHDHDNNFVGVHHGIKLGYGNITGYQCYGTLPRGVRVIDLDTNDDYKMETKNIEDFNL